MHRSQEEIFWRILFYAALNETVSFPGLAGTHSRTHLVLEYVQRVSSLKYDTHEYSFVSALPTRIYIKSALGLLWRPRLKEMAEKKSGAIDIQNRLGINLRAVSFNHLINRFRNLFFLFLLSGSIRYSTSRNRPRVFNYTLKPSAFLLKQVVFHSPKM